MSNSESGLTKKKKKDFICGICNKNIDEKNLMILEPSVSITNWDKDF